MTAAILFATAFAAGVTGAWSPCGFSMVETLGGARDRLGAGAVRASCATFALGALAGGAVTFAALAALGGVLGGAGSTAALAAAVGVALLAALGEALGVRVVPQIRRQVPEPWRRTLPLPLAAGLYGILLGLGFTTFVLTLAVWALAGISVAIGSVPAGLLIGLGFGAGRALPVVVLASRYATLGRRLELRMAEQPALLRRLRLADGALLAALAVAFLASGSASAAHVTLVAPHATDPSRTGSAFAWRRLGGGAVVLQGDARSVLAGENVAVGGRYVATRQGAALVVRNRRSGEVVMERAAPRATQLAVSDRWLVWRTSRRGGGDRLWALALPAAHAVPTATAADAGLARLVAGVKRRKWLGRPALDRNRLAYAVATPHESRIVVERLRRTAGRTRRRVLLRSHRVQYSQPALAGRRLLYVRATQCDQRLQLASLRRPRRARTLLRLGTTAHRDAGHEPHHTAQGSEPGHCPPGTPRRTDTTLWTTALAGRAAYVTLLRPGAGGAAPQARIVRVRG